jgi:Tfp pilus assembly protein PilF
MIDAGVAVDPAIRDAAGAVLGYVYHKQKKWAMAEEEFIRATNSPVVESNAFNWYSLMLGSVGRFDAALSQALAGLEIDPSSAVINARVAIVYTWIGDNEKAADYFERTDQLGGGGATQLLAHGLLLARQGQIEQARIVTKAGVLLSGGATDWVDPVIAALVDPAQRATALAAI